MNKFKMHVKTVIHGEQDKILLLKEKRMDKKPRWDLPGATFTKEESFDETVITNVQKEIGYYIYPGKIIGISDYSDKEFNEVFVIMDGTILNGELLLSKDYETSTWIDINRIKEYPLVPWLNNYMQNNKYPFNDVEIEIDELNKEKTRRREIIQEDIISSIPSRDTDINVGEGVKSSFSLLKDTIKRTLHPKEAQVTKTAPKDKELYSEPKPEKEKTSLTDKFNFKLNNKDKKTEDIIIKSENKPEDIIVEHYNIEDTKTDNIIKPIEKNNNKTEPSVKKAFNMNVNRQNNMKKVESRKKPEIKVIRKNDKIPNMRKEKESRERVSFTSDRLHNSNWREKINNINRTESSKNRKQIPIPKGKK